MSLTARLNEHNACNTLATRIGISDNLSTLITVKVLPIGLDTTNYTQSWLNCIMAIVMFENQNLTLECSYRNSALSDIPRLITFRHIDSLLTYPKYILSLQA